MADSLGQNWKNRDFTLASVSDLSDSSDAPSPGIARFTSDALQIHPESPQIPFNFDLRTAQILKLGPVQSLCVTEGSDDGKSGSYSTGVSIQFKNEEDCAAFHSAVQQWIKENNVQGNLPNGTLTTSKSKFDEKIEPSSAKMYFHYYGQLLHQQNMLQDYVRTGTYYAAVIENRADFTGRVVVDVGAGSGILSLFAAQAGAKHVYAVEASEMAEYARKLIAGNPKLAQRITVIKGRVEDVELPEKADILISEPMERLDPDTSGILTTLCDHSFQCPCVSKWTYLSCQVCRFCQQQDEKPACFICGTLDDVWVCMICGFVGCGRYKEGHAIRHWKDTQHCYSLDFRTQQIWDYVGDNYVHRLNQDQSKSDGKSEEMHLRCMSLEGDCGTCDCREDLEVSGAFFNSKVEAIVDEYNRLLTSQLETQRQHYETLLIEARSKAESSISEAVEKAATSGMLDIQNELEKCTEERNAVAEVNRKLIKNSEMWRKKVKEAEEREAASVKSMNERVLDLEEQIRDITIFLEAQKTIDKMSDSNGIKEGTVLPVANEQPSPGNSKRNRKSGRRRH